MVILAVSRVQTAPAERISTPAHTQSKCGSKFAAQYICFGLQTPRRSPQTHSLDLSLFSLCQCVSTLTRSLDCEFRQAVNEKLINVPQTIDAIYRAALSAAAVALSESQSRLQHCE